MVTLSPDGEILVDNQEVGQLIYDENHIKKIEINHSEQNQGYGTEALRQYLDQIEAQGYSHVTTSPATSPVIEHIFKKLGFRRVEDPSEVAFLDGVEKRYKMCFVKELNPGLLALSALPHGEGLEAGRYQPLP